RPIKANFREGLSVVGYFIATHGARKGLADTALRTADSGYLTRRLVAVSQDVIIREAECGTAHAIRMPIATRGADGRVIRHPHVEPTIFARMTADDITDADGKVLVPAHTDLGDVLIDRLIAVGVESVRLRSVLTCDSSMGTCAMCYGRSLATGKLVDVGEAVGIIAAQSLGEPGPPPTLRAFPTARRAR